MKYLNGFKTELLTAQSTEFLEQFGMVPRADGSHPVTLSTRKNFWRENNFRRGFHLPLRRLCHRCRRFRGSRNFHFRIRLLQSEWEIGTPGTVTHRYS